MHETSHFKGRLKRLPGSCYCGHAIVHWTYCMESRKTNWLTDEFHVSFREALIHTTFRFAVCCPTYCCLPDHIHMLWVGLSKTTDQRPAIRYLSKQLNLTLEESNFRFQRQAYDRVLRRRELEANGMRNVAQYIIENPSRLGLVPRGEEFSYPYLGNVMPGYPELELRQSDYWIRLDRVMSFARDNGLRSPFKQAK